MSAKNWIEKTATPMDRVGANGKSIFLKKGTFMYFFPVAKSVYYKVNNTCTSFSEDFNKSL